MEGRRIGGCGGNGVGRHMLGFIMGLADILEGVYPSQWHQASQSAPTSYWPSDDHTWRHDTSGAYDQSWQSDASHPHESHSHSQKIQLHAAPSNKPLTAFSLEQRADSQTVYGRSKTYPHSHRSKRSHHDKSKKRQHHNAPHSTRDGTELQEHEIYLDNITCDDDQWVRCVEWARKHPQRVKAANELREADRPKPCIKSKQDAMRHFSEMLRDRCKEGIPAQAVNNLVKVFGAADLINAVVASDIHTVHLPDMKLTAGVIPVPDMERFNPKPAFGGSTSHTWGLVRGTTLTRATAILIEGLIRPADWEHDDDSKKSQLPTFGLFSSGQQISPGDAELPHWAEQTLLDRASKRG